MPNRIKRFDWTKFLPALETNAPIYPLVTLGIDDPKRPWLLKFIPFPASCRMRMIEAVDKEPTPWFWGINGATSVLASVMGVILSMSFGINVTMLIAAACYLLLIPTSFALSALREQGG